MTQSSPAFDAATAGVEAGVVARARCGGARVVSTRHESMAARNGDIEDLNQTETVGVGVRALVGSSWGFFGVPDLTDAVARGAGARAAGIAQASSGVPGPAADLVPVQSQVGSWANVIETDPFEVSLATKGDLLAGATSTSH